MRTPTPALIQRMGRAQAAAPGTNDKNIGKRLGSVRPQRRHGMSVHGHRSNLSERKQACGHYRRACRCPESRQRPYSLLERYWTQTGHLCQYQTHDRRNLQDIRPGSHSCAAGNHASALYGMYEVFSSVGVIWPMLTGDGEVRPMLDVSIVSEDGRPFVGALGIPDQSRDGRLPGPARPMWCWSRTWSSPPNSIRAAAGRRRQNGLHNSTMTAPPCVPSVPARSCSPKRDCSTARTQQPTGAPAACCKPTILWCG